MHDLVSAVLQANLAAAVAILLVLVLRKAARPLFGVRIAYALWLLVPLAAAASLAPPRPGSLLPAPPAAPAALVDAAEQGAAALWIWGAETVAPAGLDPMDVVLTLWVTGLVAMVGWLAWRQWQFLRLLQLGEAGPAVIGFLKPRIVTPSDFEDRFDRREQAVVLAHEKIHLARHDARINALVALARCVCWFNPLVHVAAHTMRIDQELACDAAVVERHPKARAPYAQALLKAQLAAKPLPLGCYWPAGTEHPLTERIAMLKRSNPSRLRRLAGVAAIVALSAGAGYAAWAAAPATAPAAAAPVSYIQQALRTAPALTPAPAAERVKAPASRPTAPTSARVVAMIDLEPIPADASAASAAPIPSNANPYGKVTYVGSAQIPPRQPFVRFYDANAPVKFRGKVTGIRLTDGMSSDFLVQAESGKIYRVIGGDPAGLTTEGRAQAQALVGATIDVRGYLAYDQSCELGCIVNGRDVSYPDGSAVINR